MGALVGTALKFLAGLLDKYVPGQGSRTVAVAILTIIANVTMFLTGQATAEVAGNNIVLAAGLIFASKHKADPPSPQPPQL